MHGCIEELHLLHGILKVDDRTQYPGDFRRAASIIACGAKRLYLLSGDLAPLLSQPLSSLSYGRSLRIKSYDEGIFLTIVGLCSRGLRGGKS
jgi:hypothetical protein